MRWTIPHRLAAACRGTPERAAWLARLDETLRRLEERWSLTLEQPFDGDDVSCAWVAAATRADGTRAVLKLGMPHMEGEQEIAGLRLWNGDPTVRLLESDDDLQAMLLERCEPGTALRTLPEPDQDVVVATLLRRLWRLPSPPHPFRPLSALTCGWRDETLARAADWPFDSAQGRPDAGLVRAGLHLLDELPRSAGQSLLLATDLHAGNVLRAGRQPWLVIDPKPFVGDPAYDATQHLLNCEARLSSDAAGTIRRFADLLELNPERIRLWLFARAAAEPRDDWGDDRLLRLARSIAP
jgi:streptomycin 6-kinase